MSKQHIPLTPEQVKSRFRERGETVKGWCLERGYSPSTAYAVLNGASKNYRGKAHEVAVALGLKVGPDATEDRAP